MSFLTDWQEFKEQGLDSVKKAANAYVDIQINGEIAYVSTFEKNSASRALFNTYRYSKAKVTKA